MKFINIGPYNLEFKHLFSAPAQVGRILNYVIRIGKEDFYHKNGNRTLKDDIIGSAWTTEFLVGLDLARYDLSGSDSGLKKMYLTTKGQMLFDEIKDFEGSFNEKTHSTAKRQLESYNEYAYAIFKDIFVSSVVFKNLQIYVTEVPNALSGGIKAFYNNYYCELKSFYTGEDYIHLQNGGATTAENRGPSLIQLCEFFGFIKKKQGNNVFVFDDIEIDEISKSFLEQYEYTEDLITDERSNLDIINELVEKYGEDGNVIQKSIVRNSRIQHLFRKKLLKEFDRKCAITRKYTPEILVASHIKPSVLSNVHEKLNSQNGLLLSANYDRLFDKYLISFDYKTGKILISNYLGEFLKDYGLDPEFVLAKRFLTEERKKFLMHHNKEFNNKKM